ncbi:MAG TPA: hypothetical protein VEI97_15080, partial [bacterium]|nr:hypothetical protein [bacterium]
MFTRGNHPVNTFTVRRLLVRGRGATALEYALLLIFVAVIVSRWPSFLAPPIQNMSRFLLNFALPRI